MLRDSGPLHWEIILERRAFNLVHSRVAYQARTAPFLLLSYTEMVLHAAQRAGAASAGGRFNRSNVEALYLSAEPETALAEYRQGSSLPRPATLAAYALDLTDVVDLSAGYDPDHWTAPWADWNCDWRWIARVEHKVPTSWKLGDEVIRSGAAGLLFPSTHQAGGTNIVVFGANLTTADRLAVHDPDDMLPKDQRSWER